MKKLMTQRLLQGPFHKKAPFTLMSQQSRSIFMSTLEILHNRERTLNILFFFSRTQTCITTDTTFRHTLRVLYPSPQQTLCSAKVLEDVPLCHRLATFGKHLIPMFLLHGAAFGPKDQLTNLFIAAHAVIVHDGYHKARLANAVVSAVEDKGLIKHRVQCLFFY